MCASVYRRLMERDHVLDYGCMIVFLSFSFRFLSGLLVQLECFSLSTFFSTFFLIL
jgi:hypothetical protein